MTVDTEIDQEPISILGIRSEEFLQQICDNSQNQKKRTEIHAGWGACWACDCRGYVRGKEVSICKCGHHYSRHK